MAISEDTFGKGFFLIAIALFIFGIGIAIGKAMGALDHEREAVKQGHAVWSHDETGKSKFEWHPASDHQKIEQ